MESLECRANLLESEPSMESLNCAGNTVAICEIDLQSGEVSREMYFDRDDLGAIVVPKLFDVDYRTNEMLFYAVRGKKEQFGRLTFGE